MNQTKTGLRIEVLKLLGLQRVAQEISYLQIDLFSTTKLGRFSQMRKKAYMNNERI